MIKQYDRHELIFDTNFMGGPRTDDFLIIQITAGRPRTVEVKSHLFLAITENLHGQVPSSGVWRVILRGVTLPSSPLIEDDRPHQREKHK